MYELEIVRQISAAHRLCGYPGDCAKLHGHNFMITAVLQVRELDTIGISVDFKRLKKVLDEVIEPLDHADLNNHVWFKEVNPTSENLARLIYQDLGSRLNDGNVKVARIKISESPTSTASYFED